MLFGSISANPLLTLPDWKSAELADWLAPPVEPSNGTPSTINNGWFPPVIEENPRIIMLEPLPETPPVPVILTPAALPRRILAISVSARCSISSLETVDTAYPSAFFSVLIPCAVTITSSRALSG